MAEIKIDRELLKFCFGTYFPSDANVVTRASLRNLNSISDQI